MSCELRPKKESLERIVIFFVSVSVRKHQPKVFARETSRSAGVYEVERKSTFLRSDPLRTWDEVVTFIVPLTAVVWVAEAVA